MLKFADGNVNIDPSDPLYFIIRFFDTINLDVNLITILIFILIFFLIKGFANFLSKSYRVVLRQRLIKNLRNDIISNVNQLSYKEFVGMDIGRMQNTMTAEVEKVQTACRAYLQTTEQLILILVYLYFLVIIDIGFTLMAFLAGLVNYLLFSLIFKKTKSSSKIVTRDQHDFQGLVVQYINNFKYLKSTGSINIFSKKILKMIKSIEKSKRRLFIDDALLQAVREPLLIFIVVIIIFIKNHYMGTPISLILISLLFFYRAATSIVTLQVSYNQFLVVSASLDNMIKFVNEIKYKEEKNGDISIEKIKNSIKIINGSINFGTKHILKNINLHIKKNETIAVVGESGSGKTTLLNALCCLIPLSSGQIKIDGIDSESIDLRSYRKQIGYITQEPVIFNDTVYNNITFWSEKNNSTDDKFKNATKNALIYDYINELPENSNSVLGFNGFDVSGGQRQRISIARELFKGANIMIFDEATSNLDSKIEKSIRKNIDNLMGSYTIFIVAHRLSTIKNSDRIIMLKDGEIQSVADYNDLIKNNKDFKKMIELQKIN